MTLRNPYRGVSQRPFPGAEPTLQLRQEDEFMQLHGGAGARSIYLAVEALSDLMTLACHPMARLARVIGDRIKIRRRRGETASSQRACETCWKLNPRSAAKAAAPPSPPA